MPIARVRPGETRGGERERGGWESRRRRRVDDWKARWELSRGTETALAVHEALSGGARGRLRRRGERRGRRGRQGEETTEKTATQGIGYIASKGRGRHVGTQANMLMVDLADEETVRETPVTFRWAHQRARRHSQGIGKTTQALVSTLEIGFQRVVVRVGSKKALMEDFGVTLMGILVNGFAFSHQSKSSSPQLPLASESAIRRRSERRRPRRRPAQVKRISQDARAPSVCTSCCTA